MKSELENIELLVDQIIALARTETINEEKVRLLEQSVLTETTKIKNSFTQQFLSGDPEKTPRRFFQLQAKSLVALLDDIQDKTAAVGHGTSNWTAISVLYNAVESLVIFLRGHFAEYFEHGFPAPKRFSENAIAEIKKGMEKLLATLSNNGVDDIIRELIAVTFQKSRNNLTYEQLFYFQLLLSELLRIDWSSLDPDQVKQVFINTLLKLNYNEAAFLHYYTGYSTDALAGLETLSEKIERLGYITKLVNQTFVMPGVVSDPALPGIKVQILEWLSHEMDYYQLKLQLVTTGPKDDLLINKDFKMIFDMSVSYVAFLFKLFVETGVIQNKNTAELIRFLAKFVKTKRAETVSYDSFRAKFYNTETGTKEAVKKTLQSLLNYINQN